MREIGATLAMVVLLFYVNVARCVCDENRRLHTADDARDDVSEEIRALQYRDSPEQRERVFEEMAREGERMMRAQEQQQQGDESGFARAPVVTTSDDKQVSRMQRHCIRFI